MHDLVNIIECPIELPRTTAAPLEKEECCTSKPAALFVLRFLER